MLLSHTARAFQTQPVTPLQKRNTLADWAFYDVGNLSREEFDWLAGNLVLDGSILVVHPGGEAGSINVAKYDDHASLSAAPGDMLEHFAIAGVGSSDVGAASLARTRANQLGKPVGAIVAGYGMADILQEALGGWFFFGAANRMQAFVDRYSADLSADTRESAASIEETRADIITRRMNDTATLLKLLRDKGRKVKSLLGHSKGCLSIAFAMNDVNDEDGAKAMKRLASVEIITAGAVVSLPDKLTHVRQYLGAIDWFGGLNSIPGIPFTRIPNAWHHVNTDLPCHIDLRRVLDGRYDS